MVAAYRFACEVGVNRGPRTSTLRVVVVAMAFAACQTEETWIAFALQKMAMNVGTLYPSKFLHQTLYVVAGVAAAAEYDWMDAQLMPLLSQQQLLRRYQCGDFDGE